jgi:predicted nuclease of predicted toxin-antitoxin system
MRILIDECVPIAVRKFFGPNHEVFTVEYMRWRSVKNGKLLAAAEAANFEVLITCDSNMYKDHDLTGRKIGVAVLPTNKLKALKDHADQVVAFVLGSQKGQYHTCYIGEFASEREPRGFVGPTQ